MRFSFTYIFVLIFAIGQLCLVQETTAQKLPSIKKRMKKGAKPVDKSTGVDKFKGPVAVYPATKVQVGDYSGDIPMKGVKKRNRFIDGSNKNKARYSGNIANKDLNRISRAARKTDKQRANYKGNIPYVNLKKMRAKRYAQMAKYRGFIKVKKAPKKVTTKTRQKRFYKKPYDIKKKKKGLNRLPLIGVRKADIPRWQREKIRKPKYDKSENELWAQPREVPVKPKESRSKVKEDDNQDKE